MLLLLACVAAFPESDQELLEGFTTLHAPLYEVYAQDSPDGLHSLLAGSYTGSALTQAYVEHFLALQRLTEQQTTIEITGLTYDALSVRSRAAEQVRLDAEWTVRGVITHRGHSHTRTNRYAAIYTLSPTDDGLRITDTRLRNLERLTGRLSTGDRGGLTPLELLSGSEL